MKFKYLFLLVVFVVLGCETKEAKYPKELQKIFNAHGGLDAWNNVKTVSFKIQDESFTIDMETGRKVINAPNYSLGFDGKNYWLSQKDSSFVRTPDNYINSITKTFMMPFSLASEVIYDEKIQDSKISYRNREISFDQNNNITKELIKGNLVIEFDEWQEVTGFKLPKKVKRGLIKSNKVDRLFTKELEFSDVELSQMVLADSFYQNPN